MEDYIHDMSLINESGATAMRLTHYHHGNPMYDLSDKNGIVLWTEIPLVGPGGYTGPGYVKSENLERNTKTMLIEMIRQHINHPSVFFWGLFNELKSDYDDPVPFIKELNAVSKEEDPSRLTTCACFGNQLDYLGATDLIGWNKYFGWNFADFGSSIRNEGDQQGINDKGLITYDHQTKKDAFYFYKANWNTDPMIYITSRRFVDRTAPITDIKIFTNAIKAELVINGKRIGTQKTDEFKTII